MHAMQKSPGVISFYTGAFLHNVDVLCEVAGGFIVWAVSRFLRLLSLALRVLSASFFISTKRVRFAPVVFLEFSAIAPKNIQKKTLNVVPAGQ